jgi:hypothetical protein
MCVMSLSMRTNIEKIQFALPGKNFVLTVVSERTKYLNSIEQSLISKFHLQIRKSKVIINNRHT